MGDNDANAATVRDYLQELLLALLHEQDCFSGKRPFGNSGWFTCDLAPPLIKAGLVEGKLDSDDYTEKCNEAQLAAVLRQAICEQFKKP